MQCFRNAVWARTWGLGRVRIESRVFSSMEEARAGREKESLLTLTILTILNQAKELF